MIDIVCLTLLGTFRWKPGIGDPHLMGWVTVTAYLAAAYLCYRAGRGGIGEQLPPRVARIWYGLAVLLLALGINKQLDLQLLIRDLGKFALDAFAWQGKRHLIQSIYIGLVACGGMAIVGLLAWWARGAWRTVGGAFAGCVFLLCFVVVRAASLHLANLWLTCPFCSTDVSRLLELGGIAVIAASAAMNVRKRV